MNDVYLTYTFVTYSHKCLEPHLPVWDNGFRISREPV